MLGFLLAGDNLPFVVALVLMLLVGVAEVAGLGSGLVPDLDMDGSGGDASLLQWLNVGRAPFLMLLVIFLLSFGLAGLMGQRLVAGLFGGPAPWWLAAPLALAAALPITRSASRLLRRYLPTEETTAVDRDSLVGRMAVIVTGKAATGSPAQARARDVHGQPHYVMVEPDTPDETFTEGETVVLVRRSSATFFAIRGGPALQDAQL